MKINFSILIVFSFLFVHQTNALEKNVYIIDGIEKKTHPLKFHCASGNDDLGWHYPHLGSNFKFSFRSSVFTETIFFLSFLLGTRKSGWQNAFYLFVI